MGNLINLPGVNGGKIENVRFARSPSGAMAVLKTDRAVTGAGDNGAWTVWRDDEGNYRCEFSRYCATVNGLTCKAKAEVRRWLGEWIPQIHGA